MLNGKAFVYVSIWHPILGELLVLVRKEGNGHDRHTVSEDILVRKSLLVVLYKAWCSSEVTGSRLIQQTFAVEPLLCLSPARTLSP